MGLHAGHPPPPFYSTSTLGLFGSYLYIIIICLLIIKIYKQTNKRGSHAFLSKLSQPIIAYDALFSYQCYNRVPGPWISVGSVFGPILLPQSPDSAPEGGTSSDLDVVAGSSKVGGLDPHQPKPNPNKHFVRKISTLTGQFF